MHTLTQYLYTLENPDGLTRTLAPFELVRDADQRPIFQVGNRAILFKIRRYGRTMRLRCFTQPPQRDLRRLYGEALLSEELYLYSTHGGEWVDLVLEPWIEGEELEQEVRRAASRGDRTALLRLSEGFERLAFELLSAPWAHGDLKPKNILVDPQGELHLIDFDGCYLPDEGLAECPEVGTPAYQHPMRGVNYDGWIDHYPAALIAVQLRALALDPTLLARAPQCDGLFLAADELFARPRGGAPTSSHLLLEEVKGLFAAQGDAPHYRLASLLRATDYRLPDVAELLAFRPPLRPDATLESYFDRSLAGFRGEQITTPLLYDEAFDFSSGWAAVRLGSRWHYLDRRLQVALTLPAEADSAKSLRDGVVRYRMGEQWYEERVK